MTKKKQKTKNKKLGYYKEGEILWRYEKKKPDYQNDGQLTYIVSPEWHFWCRITNELHLLILLIILVNKRRRNAGVYLRSAKYNP